ncbi:MAG TPA: hypothetical protein VHD83_26825 [Puia sp.]|nr:hypothetical protein [Puia sp.]
MKKNKLFTRLSLSSAVVILIAAASCKKNNDNGAGAAGISATIGSTGWQSQYAIGVEPNGDSFIYLTGYYGKSAGDTTSFEISISDTAHVNQADPFISSDVEFYTSDNKIYSSDEFFGSHGTITVTSWDKTAHKMTGTFSGVFYNTQNSNDSLTFTNGHFNTTYLTE